MKMETSNEIERINEKPKPAIFTNRIDIIDIIRGVALLGILVINIPHFGMDTYEAKDPTTANFWVRLFNIIFFEGKMRALFSMIFGAGIVLFTSKKEQTGKSVTWLFYKRMFWLALFGLAHAHLFLWIGDILYFYGVIGMLAFLFRKMKAKYLAMGVPLVAIISFTINTMFMQQLRSKYLDYLAAKELKEAGAELGEKELAALATYEQVRKEMLPNKEESKQHIALMKGSYSDVASHIRPKAWKRQTQNLPFLIGDMLALMLLGIALYKWGFLTMKWTLAQYKKTIWIGYGLGVPLVIYSFLFNRIKFPTTDAFKAYAVEHPIIWVDLIYDFQRILIMMAHVAMVILLYKNGYFTRILNGLRAVGQMAFTNYVMHTVICTLVFFGYGLNQYHEWEYYQLFYLVIAIWILQLALSPIWLKHFLFGPLEWLWRSLTYGRFQPFKRPKTEGGELCRN